MLVGNRMTKAPVTIPATTFLVWRKALWQKLSVIRSAA